MLTLRMRQLCCDKTTEMGADEVYILVYGRRSDGASYFQRWPANNPNQASGHWDMNDGHQPTDNPSGDSHCITNKTLFSGEISPGLSWQLAVLIMEEDGGSTINLQQAAAALAQEVPNPLVQGAGLVLGVLAKLGVGIKDSDDYPGSFSLSVSMSKGGTLDAQWANGDRIVHQIPDPEDSGNPLKKEFRMNGDGSNYVGWFGVQA